MQSNVMGEQLHELHDELHEGSTIIMKNKKRPTRLREVMRSSLRARLRSVKEPRLHGV